MNDKAYAALLDILSNICRRNGIKKLVWSTSKDDRVNHKNGCNMTVHRDYANKSCPGDYLYNRHGEIAAEVNRRLGVPAEEQKPEQKPQGDAKSLTASSLARLKKDNATAFAAKLKKEVFDTYIVQIGKITRCKWARSASRRTRKLCWGEVEEGGTRRRFHYLFRHVRRDIGAEKITTGSKVRVKAGAKPIPAEALLPFVYSRDPHRQRAFGKRRDYYGGTVVAAVNVDDLTLV